MSCHEKTVIFLINLTLKATERYTMGSMKIIGHRGAAGLKLENTLEAFRCAKELGVDAVEFDVRLTKDGVVVVCHDHDLSDVSGSNAKISEITLSELKEITLNNGETAPTLGEALSVIGGMQAIIEVKVGDCAEELAAVLDKFPNADVVVASFNHGVLIELKALRPEVKVYLAERTQPFEIITNAINVKARGLDLSIGILNPITYWLARRRGLEIMVYTVNSRFIAGFIRVFYPKVAICTNYPDRFIRWRKPKSDS